MRAQAADRKKTPIRWIPCEQHRLSAARDLSIRLQYSVSKCSRLQHVSELRRNCASLSISTEIALSRRFSQDPFRRYESTIETAFTSEKYPTNSSPYSNVFSKFYSLVLGKALSCLNIVKICYPRRISSEWILRLVVTIICSRKRKETKKVI